MAENEVAQLKNLGPRSANMLQAAGIASAAQIRNLGAVGTFLLVRQNDAKVSLNLLWALEGFLTDRDWRELSENDKSELLDELNRSHQ